MTAVPEAGSVARAGATTAGPVMVTVTAAPAVPRTVSAAFVPAGIDDAVSVA